MRPEYFATNNANKLREVNQILNWDLKMLNLELAEVQSLDPVEVAQYKAEEAFKKSGKPIITEDTSLAIEAWSGLPGALIMWFIKTVGVGGIVKMMSSEKNRTAIAKTAVAFRDVSECYIFTGEIQGIIPQEVRGTSGFGWDPIFIPAGYQKSFAEMDPEDKNSISMRKIAFTKLREFVDKKLYS